MKFIFFIFCITITYAQTYDDYILAKMQQDAPILCFHPREGPFCCYPSAAEPAYQKIMAGQFHEDMTPKKLDPQTPCYFQYWIGTQNGQTVERKKYWIWYNFNKFSSCEPLGWHEGDWENIEVILYNGVVKFYWLSNHEKFIAITPEQAKLKDGHVIAYVARGSHAHYPSLSSPMYEVMGLSDCVGNGQTWDTRSSLIPLSSTPFADFQGKWGNHNYELQLFGATLAVFDPPQSPVTRQFEYASEDQIWDMLK